MATRKATFSTERRARAAEFGVDVTDALVWGGGTWQPGGEFRKKIVVKNVSPKIIKIKYKLPKTRFFHMEFPEPLRLSAGTSCSLDVSLRPVQLEEYEDFVEFFVQGVAGSFRIPVRAHLARLAVELSADDLDLEACPVNEVSHKSLSIHNTGEIPAAFGWDVAAPFQVVPAAGVVPPGKSQPCRFSFAPVKAAQVRGRAVCTFEGSHAAAVHLHGAGKFPFVTLDAPHVDFGNVLIGSSGAAVNKAVTLTNVSEVWTTFKVVARDTSTKRRFDMRPAGGRLAPGASAALELRYRPTTNGMHSSEFFDVVTPGGNTVTVNAVGTACGPYVTVARKDRAGASAATTQPLVFNFGDVKVGASVTHVAVLTNHSNTPAFFQFQAETRGVFSMSAVHGVVPALLQHGVNLTFTPDRPGNFYRRLYCLVRDGEPAYVDLVATAYDEHRRPAPLKWRHVEAYRRRPLAMRRLSPDELTAAMAEGWEPTADGAPALERELPLRSASRSGDATRGANAVAAEFFTDVEDAGKSVVLAPATVDFGGSSRFKPADKREVVVKNRTHAKLSVDFFVPGSHDGDDEPDWAVFPPSAEVGPGRSAAFRVAFRPSQDSFYYAQELEAYASFKSNRSFRLVDDATFTPPWCLPVRVFGHTFSNAEQFLPKVDCNLPHAAASSTAFNLAFPACHVGDAAYQTFQLVNASSTPAFFQFFGDVASPFRCVPQCGLIPGNSFQLVMARFKPGQPRDYAASLGLEINNSSSNSLRVRATGTGALPRLSLPDGPTVYVKPTCLGVTSSRACRLRNTSPVPLEFSWRLPAKAAEVLAVHPATGTIRGGEETEILWTFAPRASDDFSLRVPCDVFSSGVLEAGGGGAPPLQRLSVTVQSRGTSGAIVFDPPAVDFGVALVGSVSRVPLTLENMSDCSLSFRIEAVVEEEVASLDLDNDGIIEHHELAAYRGKLARTAAQRGEGAHEADVKAGDEGGAPTPKPSEKPPSISFDPPSGAVPAHTRMRTHVLFKPKAAGRYVLRAFYEVTSLPNTLAGLYGVTDTLAGGTQPDSPSKAALAATVGRSLGGTLTLTKPPGVRDPLAPVPPPALNADPLWCEVRAVAGYPTFVVEDARLFSSPQAVVAHLNATGLADVVGPAKPGASTRPGSVVGRMALGRLSTKSEGGQMGALASAESPSPSDVPVGLFANYRTTRKAGRAKEAQSTPHLWSALGLPDLNRFLTTPLTPEEVATNKKTRLTLDPDALPTFTLELPPAPVGAPPSVIVLNLRNTGAIPVEFEFITPDDLGIEVEQWAERGPPSPEALLAKDLLDAQVFGITPKAVALAPGHAASVYIHYAYLIVPEGRGPHEVSVILRIARGKQIRLVLRGTTVPKRTPLLAVPAALPRRLCPLAAVPIGVMEAPLQSVPLFNPSDVDVAYTVDTDPLDALAAASYGFAVLKCVNPEGIVAARGQAVLQFVFQPLEARAYTAELTVMYTHADGVRAQAPAAAESLTITLEGSGYQLAPGARLVGLPAVVAPDVASSVAASHGAAVELLALPGVSGLETGDDEVLVGPAAAAKAAADAVLSSALAVAGVPPGGDSGAAPAKAVTTGFTFRPGSVPKLCLGTSPPLRRHVAVADARFPEGMAALSQEWLRVGDVPVGGVATRLVVLRNTRPRGGVDFFWDPLHPLLRRGLVRMHPSSGTVPAGGFVAVRVSFTADCAPEVFEANIGCFVRMPEEEVAAITTSIAEHIAKARMDERRAAAAASSRPPTEPPRQSVVSRTTTTRQSNLEAIVAYKRERGKPILEGTLRQIEDGAQSIAIAAETRSAIGVGNVGISMEGDDETMARMFRAQGLEPVVAPAVAATGRGRGSVASARSARSRLSFRSQGVQPGDRPVLPHPPQPSTAVFLHLSARVCGAAEFADAHGVGSTSALFMPRQDDAVPGGAAAGGGEGGEGGEAVAPKHQSVLADVMGSLLAELVNEADVAGSYPGLPTSPVPLFREMRQAVADVDGSPPGDVDETRERLAALAAPECQQLVGRFVENTVLNLMREALHGEFDVTQPVTVVYRK